MLLEELVELDPKDEADTVTVPVQGTTVVVFCFTTYVRVVVDISVPRAYVRVVILVAVIVDTIVSDEATAKGFGALEKVDALSDLVVNFGYGAVITTQMRYPERTSLHVSELARLVASLFES